MSLFIYRYWIAGGLCNCFLFSAIYRIRNKSKLYLDQQCSQNCVLAIKRYINKTITGYRMMQPDPCSVYSNSIWTYVYLGWMYPGKHCLQWETPPEVRSALVLPSYSEWHVSSVPVLTIDAHIRENKHKLKFN